MFRRHTYWDNPICMKIIFNISGKWILSIALLFTVHISSAQGSVSFQVFYEQLAPYGSWVNYNQYGYVWIPTSVSTGFRPYGTSGHWVFTSDGWTWLSNYNWGWAPFHYGNWFYDDAYGWMWMPGYDWAPAWVTWGEYGGNYGWAPIGPNIQIGEAWNSYRPPAHYWTFLPRAYMTRSNMSSYYIHYNTNVTIINNITVINNINSGGGRGHYMRGPQASNVEKYTHAPVRPFSVRESAHPVRAQVQNGQVAIYRPAVSRNTAGHPVAPARVQSLQSVKPRSLPGYNRNVRPGNKPSEGNAGRPSPGTGRPADRTAPAPSRPNPGGAPNVNPGNRSTRPARNNYRPASGNGPGGSNHPTPGPQLTPHQPAEISHPENRPPADRNHQPARSESHNDQPVSGHSPHAPASPRPSQQQPGPAPSPQQQRAAPVPQEQRPAPSQQRQRPATDRQRPAPEPQPRTAPQPEPRPAPEDRPGDRNPR